MPRVLFEWQCPIHIDMHILGYFLLYSVAVVKDVIFIVFMVIRPRKFIFEYSL